MKHLTLLIALLLIVSAHKALAQTPPPVMAPGQEGHGADALSVGGALEIWDRVEHDKSFKPAKEKPYLNHLKPRLERFKQLFRRGGILLSQKFDRGIDPQWYFVKPKMKLKDIKDEGASPLVLMFKDNEGKKHQLAANKGTVVYFDKEVHDQLSELSQAWSYMHEALISAIGVEFVKDGAQIRELTSLFMNEDFLGYTADELSKSILAIVGNKESELYKELKLDISGSSSEILPKGWFDFSRNAQGKPVSSCLEATDQCVFKNKTTGLYWSGVAPKSGKNLNWKAAQEACKSLKNWGGFSDWRLPSSEEMKKTKTAEFTAIVAKNKFFGPNTQITWSETPHQTDSARAMATDMRNGSEDDFDIEDELEWRCVRSDTAKYWTDMSYLLNGEELKYSSCHRKNAFCRLKDRNSGILWSQLSPNQKATTAKTSYLPAESACASLKAAGGVAWRIPTLEEVVDAHSRGITNAFGRYSDPTGLLSELSIWTNKRISRSVKTDFLRSVYSFSTAKETQIPMQFYNYGYSFEEKLTESGDFVSEYHYLCVQTSFSNLGPDDDGDGIPDKFDKCPKTEAGVVVVPEGSDAGCSKQQLEEKKK